MNINPFIILLSNVIDIYKFVVMAWLVISLLINFDIINRYQPIVQKILYILKTLTEPVLEPLRKILPPISGIDFSPVILFLILEFIKSAIYTYFYI